MFIFVVCNFRAHTFGIWPIICSRFHRLCRNFLNSLIAVLQQLCSNKNARRASVYAFSSLNTSRLVSCSRSSVGSSTSIPPLYTVNLILISLKAQEVGQYQFRDS